MQEAGFRRPSRLFRRPLAILLPLLLLALGAARAQETTYTVTVVEKTSDHPFDGQGFNLGFAIDGDEGAELTLVRGETYEFVMDGVPALHPFYLTESELGAGAPAYDAGVTNNFASGNETLTFTPPADAPEAIYYQCQNHARMGYRINIASATPAEGSTDLPERFELHGNAPNPFNPTTTVRFDLPRHALVRVEVFDALGRLRLTTPTRRLAAGRGLSIDVDASSLPSGTYVYRIEARMVRETRTEMGKMVLIK